MKKTGLKGCVYDFSVDYDANSVSNILDILQVFDEKEWNNSKSMCLKDTSHFAMYKNVQICKANIYFNNDVCLVVYQVWIH